MDKDTKKKLIDDYKEQSRTQTGGIYLIRNTKNGKIFLNATPDIIAIQNRFESGQQFGGSFHPKMNADWALFGSSAFEIEIAETIRKNANQTPEEFMEDLQLLKKMWIEKYDPALLY